MIKILHIVPDDKFINDAKIVMDAVPNTSNSYICPTDNEKYHPVYVGKLNFVEIVSLETLGKRILTEDVDVIAFHTIPYNWYKYVVATPREVKIWWLVWGYDIYTDTSDYNIQPIIPLNLYKQYTEAYVRSLLPPSSTIFALIKKEIKILVNYNGNRGREIKRLKAIREVKKLRQDVLERIDYVSTILPLEYVMLTKKKGFHAKYVPFQYPLITNGMQFGKSSEASYILLGNSSDPTNNHLDILNIINKRNIHCKVYIPLAYGDSKYKKFITERIGSNENILIQDQFVPRDEYMSLLTNCKIAIFGHVRQQALGNVAIAMILGMKVFLYKDSVCYKYFKKNSFVVYTIEKDLTQQSINEPMSACDENTNRDKITEWLSYQNVQLAVQNFFIAEESAIKIK